ncbi:MAG: hypothetical protein ABIH86_04920 [Planctomycetota bacterium]
MAYHDDLNDLKRDTNKSFSAAARTTTPRPTNHKVLIGVLAILAGLGIYSLNAYLINHQTLHMINGFSVPLEYAIDGGLRKNIPSRQRVEETLSEGVHSISAYYPDGSVETNSITIQNGIINRYSFQNAFVYNIGGGAVIEKYRLYYTPENTPQREADYSFYIGDPFLIFRGINYRFETPPSTISMDSIQSLEQRDQLVMTYYKPRLVYQAALDEKPSNLIILYLENHLRCEPNNWDILIDLQALCERSDSIDRFEAFLESGLNRRPTSTEWHWIYQELVRLDPDRFEELEKRYDAFLAEDPSNSVWLHLAGRLKSMPAADDYFNRSIAADPNNAFPYLSKSLYLYNLARWSDSLDMARAAQRCQPNNPLIIRTLPHLLMANGYYNELFEMTDRQIALQMNADLFFTIKLEQYVAEEKLPEAFAAIRAFVAGYQDLSYEDASRLTNKYDTIVLLFDGQWDAAKEKLNTINDKTYVDQIMPYALLGAGRYDLVSDDFENAQLTIDGSLSLYIAICAYAEDDDETMSDWLDYAAENWMTSRHDYQLAAKALTIPPATVDELASLHINYTDYQLLLVAVAIRHPRLKDDCAQRATALNIGRAFPHYLIKKAVARLQREY